jgi:ubiquinone/menaquinone biosynthesis C-methylase UbiE
MTHSPELKDSRTYLPAAGRDWALPFYDPVVKLLGGDAVRRVLVEQAELQPGHRVLEIGCGTGSLLMQIDREQPAVELTGLDPDPKALERAKAKADAASAHVRLDRGFSDALPYPDASFDRVFSCFMFHHLDGADAKRRTLREVRRVLEPGGQLHLLDFAEPESQRAGGFARWLHSAHHLEDNTDARLHAFMSDAGLVAPTLVRRAKMFFVLHVAYFRAFAPMQ